METKPSSGVMTDSTRDKLCREIAERHGLNTQQFPHLIDVIVIAMLEAYDKGHDAGAREQREKLAKMVETDSKLLITRITIADAIRAGRE